MGLSAMQIFKHLPAATKCPATNCMACGCKTCMAFAIKLAAKKIDINSCPHVPNELRELALFENKVQQHAVQFLPNRAAGGETVMHRHEKTFVNPTIIACELNPKDHDFSDKLARVQAFRYKRVGQECGVDAVFFEDSPVVEPQLSDSSRTAVITRNNAQYTIISGRTPREIAQKAQHALDNGKKSLILELDIQGKTIPEMVEELTQIRRRAIIDRDAPYTHPVMVKLPYNLRDLNQVCAIASALICKYANIIVLQDFDEALLSSLFALRQSIFTNPQKPLQVEAGIYGFNEPGRHAPVLLTTNFALTYFAVANELESLPFGSYLVVTPSDGMSVLTAWSADKFTAELVARSIRNYRLCDKVDTRKIIIPGLLSHMQKELQDALPDWEIVTGTIEACRIPEFLKSV